MLVKYYKLLSITFSFVWEIFCFQVRDIITWLTWLQYMWGLSAFNNDSLNFKQQCFTLNTECPTWLHVKTTGKAFPIHGATHGNGNETWLLSISFFMLTHQILLMSFFHLFQWYFLNTQSCLMCRCEGLHQSIQLLEWKKK